MKDIIIVLIGVLIGILINTFIINPIKRERIRKECIEKGYVKESEEEE